MLFSAQCVSGIVLRVVFFSPDWFVLIIEFVSAPILFIIFNILCSFCVDFIY